MKKSLLILLAFVLVGCGDDAVPATSTNDVFRFKLYDTVWQINLPSDWIHYDQPLPGTVFVAESSDQNIVIAQKPGLDEDTKAGILNTVKENFFEFTLISEGPREWVFRGKLEAGSATRVFHQKIIPVPGTDSYLAGVCSYDFWEGRPELCSQLLSSWTPEAPTNN